MHGYRAQILPEKNFLRQTACGIEYVFLNYLIASQFPETLKPSSVLGPSHLALKKSQISKKLPLELH